MFRIIVRSKAKRDRLARIPGIEIDGSRIVFPEWLTPHIRQVLEPAGRKKKEKPDQTSLF